MNTTTRQHSAHKAKPNGKWISKALEHGQRATVAKSRVILDMAQDTASEMLSGGNDLAKKAGTKAVAYGKAHPVKVALGGVAVGFFLATRLFRK